MRVCHPLIAALLVATLPLSTVFAQAVDVTGDAQPADNPFTLGFANEGLQTVGNTVQVGDPDLGVFPDENGNFTDLDDVTGQPFYERNLNVVVGANSFGEVNITGGAILRNAHLVLGGAADAGPLAGVEAEDETNAAVNGVPGVDSLTQPGGEGVLRVSGFGSTFNNHPLIVPTPFQAPGNPEATIFNIPETWNFGNFPDDNLDGDFTFAAGTIQRDATVGYDAYVGLTGNGLLEVTAGGRVEIQDAVIVGYGPAAVGEVLVSGSGSSLVNYGGLNPVTGPSGNASEISQMIIGAFGTGELRVEEGGTVRALGGAAIGVTGSDGEQAFLASDTFDRGGRGTVIVDGPGSLWDISVLETAAVAGATGPETSGLAIGEFVEDEEAATLEPDYPSALGQGALLIQNGGVVRVNDVDSGLGGPGAGAPGSRDNGDVRIGKQGELTLAGGTLEVQDEIWSDGEISGDGDILAGRFINRALGRVIVNAGESLRIRTDQEVSDPLPTGGADPDLAGVFATSAAPTAPATPDNGFGINLGSIQVIGDEAAGIAEFQYERADDDTAAPDTERRFWNARRTDAGMTIDQAGEIIVNNGHLNFLAGSSLAGPADGLRNDGELAFVGGDNLVTGTVENTSVGRIVVAGAGAGFNSDTFVTFADGLEDNGTVLIDNSDILLLEGSDAYSGTGVLTLVGDSNVTTQGTFRLGDEVEGGGTLQLTTQNGVSPTVNVIGDFLLETGFMIGIDGVINPALTVDDTITLITVTDGFVNDLTTEFSTQAISSLPTFADPDLSPSLVVDSNGSLVLVVESISASGAGMVDPADFTGDGMVNAEDVAIFAMFFGLESGGTVLTGDANGDGAVDAADFFLLQQSFPGATLPVLSAAIAVPEPSTACLLLVTSAAAIFHRRRRV